MKGEQKEGIIVLAIACLLLASIALVSDWRGGLSTAWFGFSGFVIEDCGAPGKPFETDYSRGYDNPGPTICRHTHQFGAFDIRFTTALLLLLPVITYGLLRSLGIVRRLFKFESSLSRILSSPGNSSEEKGASEQ